jgi:Family of unknown function (DUF6412)
VKIDTLTKGRILAFFAAVFAAAILVLTVADQNPGTHAALLGILIAAVVAIGALHASGAASLRASSACPEPADRRLRGRFRRQHRPDTPGRPMPRAPGSVF